MVFLCASCCLNPDDHHVDGASVALDGQKGPGSALAGTFHRIPESNLYFGAFLRDSWCVPLGWLKRVWVQVFGKTPSRSGDCLAEPSKRTHLGCKLSPVQSGKVVDTRVNILWIEWQSVLLIDAVRAGIIVLCPRALFLDATEGLQAT